MAAYYTRAKARSEVEPKDVEQGDSASVATTTPIPITSVGLKDASMRESRSMSTEVAGSVTTHPQLLPEGGHPPVGGRGSSGSADSLQVGVTTLGYPSGLADPLDSDVVSVTDAQSTADSATATTTTGSQPTIPRQPATVADTTAAAITSPTVPPSVVDSPTRGRHRSSSVTLSPPTLSPFPVCRYVDQS